MVGVHVLNLIPQLTTVALLCAQQQLHVSASSQENMDSESKKTALIFSMDVGLCNFNVIATSKRNIMRNLFPDSINIFKKHVREGKVIKLMALLRGTI
jgi:mRNA deadenylase 3'-5' endonuclease subunit Ccr4